MNVGVIDVMKTTLLFEITLICYLFIIALLSIVIKKNITYQ